MARIPSCPPLATILMHVCLLGAILTLSLYLCGCIPPWEGKPSSMSAIYAIELFSRDESEPFRVRIASFAYCAGPDSTALACITSHNAASEIISVLVPATGDDVNDGGPTAANPTAARELVSLALDLRGRVVPGGSGVAAGLLLVLAEGGFAAWLAAATATTTKKRAVARTAVRHGAVLAALVAAALALCDAYCGAVVRRGLPVLSHVGVASGAGAGAAPLLWLAFACAALYAALLVLVTRPAGAGAGAGAGARKAQGGIIGGGMGAGQVG